MDRAVGTRSDRRKRAIARASIEAERAEEEVRQSENRLRLVIGTIPTMAWSLLPDGAVDFVNQRWLEYTGLSLEEALADPMRTVHQKTSLGSWRSGVRTWLSGTSASMKYVCAAPTGNIAGSWSAPCRCAMSREISSSGTGRVPTSRSARTLKMRYATPASSSRG